MHIAHLYTYPMKNNIIVITGGASGIGLALVKELIKENTVISLDRNPSKISALKTTFPKVESIQTDITSEEQLSLAMTAIEKKHGKIDILINNAGKGGPFDIIHSSEKQFRDGVEMEIAINYLAPLLLTKKALPLLEKSNQACVVIVSSGLAYMPIASLGGYCASKAAVHFAAMAIRHQLADIKIRVVEVLPPVVDTDMSKNATIRKMSADTFARIFLEKYNKGEQVMNIGQSAGLEKFSRFLPKTAFKALNKARS
jgi:uncharacterized oxidoreductase